MLYGNKHTYYPIKIIGLKRYSFITKKSIILCGDGVLGGFLGLGYAADFLEQKENHLALYLLLGNLLTKGLLPNLRIIFDLDFRPLFVINEKQKDADALKCYGIVV